MSNKLGLRRHDSLIDFVEEELKERGYQSVYKNTVYSRSSCGEIDLFTIRDGYVLLFEMKVTDNYKSRKKAYEQLDRAVTNCFPFSRVFKFYVSNYKEPRIEWMRRK